MDHFFSHKSDWFRFFHYGWDCFDCKILGQVRRQYNKCDGGLGKRSQWKALEVKSIGRAEKTSGFFRCWIIEVENNKGKNSKFAGYCSSWRAVMSSPWSLERIRLFESGPNGSSCSIDVKIIKQIFVISCVFFFFFFNALFSYFLTMIFKLEYTLYPFFRFNILVQYDFFFDETTCTSSPVSLVRTFVLHRHGKPQQKRWTRLRSHCGAATATDAGSTLKSLKTDTVKLDKYGDQTNKDFGFNKQNQGGMTNNTYILNHLFLAKTNKCHCFSRIRSLVPVIFCTDEAQQTLCCFRWANFMRAWTLASMPTSGPTLALENSPADISYIDIVAASGEVSFFHLWFNLILQYGIYLFRYWAWLDFNPSSV